MYNVEDMKVVVDVGTSLWLSILQFINTSEGWNFAIEKSRTHMSFGIRTCVLVMVTDISFIYGTSAIPLLEISKVLFLFLALRKLDFVLLMAEKRKNSFDVVGKYW